MGNHEFCTGCHASDFHRGLTCEEAYPEGRKQVLKRNQELADEQKLGKDKLEELKRILIRDFDIDPFYLSIENSEFGGWHMNIAAYAMVRTKK